MPFFEPANKNSGCVSLQVQKHIKKIIKNKYCLRKRAYLFASGSITIEVTIALSVFMMFMLFMQSFMIVINSYMQMQISVNNVATEVANNKYYLQVADKIAEKNKVWTDIKKEVESKLNNIEYIDKDLGEELKNTTDILYLYQRLMGEMGERILTDQICDIKNLRLGSSSIENNIVDMVVEYSIKIPFINKYLSIAQRSRVRDWTGEDISINKKEVYITEHGTVYHESRECSHLIVKISKANYSQVDELRNSNNGKYTKCLLCVKEKLQDTTRIFITEDGEKYHVDLKCSGIKRNLIAVDISQVGDRELCSRCKQGE